MAIKSLIIDDEKPARVILTELLRSHPEIEICGEAENGFEALKLIQELKLDLLFLDIQMPKINGFELLEVLDELPEVIFITAYSEFAIRAFEKNAIDYLLKPVNPDRLAEAISKSSQRKEKSSAMSFDQFKENRLEENELIDRIVVKTGSKIHIIPLDAINRIEAEDDYVSFHTAEGKYLKKQTMKFLENHLPGEDFIRIHRSHIIHIARLEKIEPYSKDNYIAILDNDDKIPISGKGYQLLRRKLDF